MSYKVNYTNTAREDIKEAKQYILHKFKYRAYAENYTRKIKEAEKRLKNLPVIPQATEFAYRNLNIYLLVHKTYMLPFVVDGNTITILRVFGSGMDWKRILQRWLKQNPNI